MASTFLRVALIAASLGLDTFAVSVGIGLRSLTLRARLRIAAAFATAEVAMTFLGTLVGRGMQHLIGEMTGYIGFAALIAIGVYMIVETFRDSESAFDMTQGWGLFVASLSVSLDALGVGFSIAYLGVPLPLTFVAIAAASGSAATLGLLLGRSFGERAGWAAGIVAGTVLIVTGLVFGVLHYQGIGLD